MSPQAFDETQALSLSNGLRLEEVRGMQEQAKKQFSRQLRKNQTEAEKLLWFHLRNKQLSGVKFRRQQPIGQYIVDFVSYEKNLIIELDGGQHSKSSTMAYDQSRTRCLESLGYKVIRFWDNDVLTHIEEVVEKVQSLLPSS